jgi:hypothetical protein
LPAHCLAGLIDRPCEIIAQTGVTGYAGEQLLTMVDEHVRNGKKRLMVGPQPILDGRHRRSRWLRQLYREAPAAILSRFGQIRSPTLSRTPSNGFVHCPQTPSRAPALFGCTRVWIVGWRKVPTGHPRTPRTGLDPDAGSGSGRIQHQIGINDFLTYGITGHPAILQRSAARLPCGGCMGRIDARHRLVPEGSIPMPTVVGLAFALLSAGIVVLDLLVDHPVRSLRALVYRCHS